MTRNLVMFVVVGLCGVSATAAAQSNLPIAVDQRVRVWTAAAEALTGRVTSISTDGFEVSNEGRAPVRVARATVKNIEVSGGVTSKAAGAKKGALWGGLISAAAGAVLAGLQHEEIGGGSSVGKAAALGAWSGGLFGALIGAGVGAARAGENWEQVWP